MAPQAPPLCIAVFGSSEPHPGTPEYDLACEIGRLLARSGFGVINGGYGGVMEASAKGAREAGGRATGVTTTALRLRSGANRFIDTEISTPDLFERTRRLIEGADGFLILPGRSGTLAEITFLWALMKGGLLGPKPIVAVGQVWEELLAQLQRLDFLDPGVALATRTARTPREAVEKLEAALEGARPGSVSGNRPAQVEANGVQPL